MDHSQTDRPRRHSPLLVSLLSFLLIAFGVWLVSAGKRYRNEYAQATEGWRIGTTQMVEVTLVAEDARNLACASDVVVAGLKCGYRWDRRPAPPPSAGEPDVLLPYNTVGNQLLLAAGLWRSLYLDRPLPKGRFSAVCNYRIQGVMRSVAVRFDADGAFGPVSTTVAVGTLADCVIPR